MPLLNKYPRTPHLEGSRLQPGDEDLASVSFDELAGRHLVVEEKLDGANAGLRFDDRGRLWLQSRGHYLAGGERERQFALYKQWASTHAHALFRVLGSRHVLYGEWVYAKHTIFYDALPHYFHEFDILDTETGHFLSTPRRRQLLAGLPLVSVPVLREGAFARLEELTALVGRSRYKGPRWADRLAEEARARGLDPDLVARQTDPSDLMEGLYVKHEEQGRVVGRYKWIRASFLSAVLDSGSHWLRRPVLPNVLAPGVGLFGDPT